MINMFAGHAAEASRHEGARDPHPARPEFVRAPWTRCRAGHHSLAWASMRPNAGCRRSLARDALLRFARVPAIPMPGMRTGGAPQISRALVGMQPWVALPAKPIPLGLSMGVNQYATAGRDTIRGPDELDAQHRDADEPPPGQGREVHRGRGAGRGHAFNVDNRQRTCYAQDQQRGDER